MLAYWIALNGIKGLGPTRINALIGEFKNPKAVFDASPRDLCSISGINQDIASRLSDSALFDEATRQIDTATTMGAHILTLDDARYPRMLKEIFAPPPVIYALGDLETFTIETMAMVGTRHPTTYGKSVAAKLSEELCAEHIALASGLASGIDTIVHETCIAKNGKTIAVLGCGIDIVYPAHNRALMAKIPEFGVLVSEFPFGTRPESFNFPRRNRIISGLSKGTCVIEAGERSGALITSSFALAQSRDVFAVPGSIFSPLSAGPHNLIRQGAVPVTCGADIVQMLRPETHVLRLREESLPLRPTQFFSESEMTIMKHLSSQPVHIAALTELSGHSVSNLLGLLLNLELRNALRQLPGQHYVAI